MARRPRATTIGREIDDLEPHPDRDYTLPAITVYASRGHSISTATGQSQEVLDPEDMFLWPVSMHKPTPLGLGTLSEVQDRRIGAQEELPARSRRRAAADITGRPRVRGRTVPASHKLFEALWFKYPAHALVCVSRKRRRQVLFASGRAGKAPRRGSRGPYSHVRC